MCPLSQSPSPSTLIVSVIPSDREAASGWLGNPPGFSSHILRTLEPPAGLSDSKVFDWLGYDALSAACEHGSSRVLSLSLWRSTADWLLARVEHSPLETRLEFYRGTLGDNLAEWLPAAATAPGSLPTTPLRTMIASEPELFARRSVVWSRNEASVWTPLAGWTPHAVLSGSFFPRHSGHDRFGAAAAQFLNLPLCYELPLLNADKPALDHISLDQRARQFDARHRLLVTTVPTFAEKSLLLPRSTFLIGWDTAVRVLDRRFSPGGELECTLDQIAAQQCRFLVAARTIGGVTKTLRDLSLPPGYEFLFGELPVDRFHEQISSTEIRARWWRGEIASPLPTFHPELG